MNRHAHCRADMLEFRLAGAFRWPILAWVLAGAVCGLLQQRVDVLLRGEPHSAKLRPVQTNAERAHRVYFEPLRHTRFVTNQPLDVGAKRMRERL